MVPTLLVAAQFALLGLWLASGHVVSASLPARLVQIAGGLLALWSFAWMIAAQRRMFRISPDPTGHATLVVTGPYRWIRHPMYASILFVVAPPVLESRAALPIAGLALLTAVLLVKLTVEERLLALRFPGYPAYRERTWRLLPYVL
ncbi:MAG: isoprenylcysteine carboxylmethyltransferase family protein [Burkholderiales bacterium]